MENFLHVLYEVHTWFAFIDSANRHHDGAPGRDAASVLLEAFNIPLPWGLDLSYGSVSSVLQAPPAPP